MRAESMKLYEPANILEFDNAKDNELNMIFESNSNDIVENKQSVRDTNSSQRSNRNITFKRRRSLDPKTIDTKVMHNLTPNKENIIIRENRSRNQR